MRDTAWSTAAPAARCRNLRRGSFISPSQRIIEILVSVRLDACELDHLAPLLGFVCDELAKVGGRACKHRRAEVSNARLHLGIGEARVDLLVELVNDLGGRVLGHA